MYLFYPQFFFLNLLVVFELFGGLNNTDFSRSQDTFIDEISNIADDTNISGSLLGVNEVEQGFMEVGVELFTLRVDLDNTVLFKGL